MAGCRLCLLFRLWWVHLRRRQTEVQGGFERRLLWAVGGLLGLGALSTGLMLERMLWMVSPTERLPWIHASTLSLVLFWPLLQSLWQEGPDVPFRSWLLWPTSRTCLAHALQLLSLLHGTNGILSLFLLGLWMGSIAPRFAALPALGWLLAATLLTTGVQWTTNLLRLLRYTWPGVYACVWLSILAGLSVLSQQDGLAWLAAYTLAAPLDGQSGRLVILLVLNVVLYGIGLSLIRCTLYLDHPFLGRVPTKVVDRPRRWLPATWQLALLQIRLLWRHRFTRFAAFYLPLLLGALGGAQLLIGLTLKHPLYILIGIALLLAATLPLPRDILSLQSAFADGLFTWPLSYRILGSATLLVTAAQTLLAFLAALSLWGLLALLSTLRPTTIQVQQLAALYLHLVGLGFPLVLWEAPLHAVRIELTSRSLAPSKRTFYRRPWRLLGLVLALVGVAGGGLLVGRYGILLLGLSGGTGLLLYPYWLDLLERRLKRHKYELLAHLRAI
ncbi:MAG: DUF5687 family protein [Rhodothermus sp.]|nr:DUF5687 family protein [Rhodothermus sp.]